MTFREDPFSSLYCKVTNRQTHRQTNAGHYITSLGGGNSNHICILPHVLLQRH